MSEEQKNSTEAQGLAKREVYGRAVEAYSEPAYSGRGGDNMSATYEALEDLLQPKGPSLKDFYTLLKKRKRLILGTALTIFGLGTFYALSSNSLYTATATVEIRGYSPVLGNAEVETLLENDTRKLMYQATTTAKLTHLSLADDVLSRNNGELANDVKKYVKANSSRLSKLVESIVRILFGAKQEENSDGRYHYPDTFLNRYYKLIQINPVHDTSLVQIRATTADRRLSQKLANAHAEGMIRHLLDEHRSELSNHLVALKTHADDLQEKLSRAEADVGKYAKDHQLVSLTDGAQGNLMLSSLTDLSKLLSAAQSQRVQSESKVSKLSESKKLDSPILDDETVKDLRTKLKDAESEYASLSQVVTGEYPKLLELQGKINSLRQTIQDERSGNLSALKTQYQSDIAAEELLRKQFETQIKKAHEMSTQLVQYNLLQREATSLRDLTQSVLKSLNETQISSSSSMSNVFISDYAPEPRLPSAPRRGVIIVISFILGAMAGIGAAIIRELLDSTIKVSEDAQAALGIPTLGIIPSFKALGAANLMEKEKSFVAKVAGFLPQFTKKKAETGTTESVDESENIIVDPQAAAALQDSRSDAAATETNEENIEASIAEACLPQTDNNEVEKKTADVPAQSLAIPEAGVLDALRTLRVNILFSSTQNASRVIMVSSAREREGKTSVVANLAITYARASQRTLLIDGDLRRPKISRRFGISNEQLGLVDYLAGQASLEEVVVHSPINHLMIIPAGSPTVNPTELLGSVKMEQLIDALRNEFDVILFDGAPVLPVADSLMLAQFADSVIFVVRSGKTEKAAAQEGVKRLRRVGAKVRGVVLNDFDPGEGSYSSDSYSVSRYKIIETDRPKNGQTSNFLPPRNNGGDDAPKGNNLRRSVG